MPTAEVNWRRLAMGLLVIVFFAVGGGLLAINGLSDEVDDLDAANETLTGQVDRLQTGLELVSLGQAAARERGFANRAASCRTEVLDGERNYALTAACSTDEIIAYYPPEVCEVHFPGRLACATKANDPAL